MTLEPTAGDRHQNCDAVRLHPTPYPPANMNCGGTTEPNAARINCGKRAIDANYRRFPHPTRSISAAGRARDSGESR